jgi:hypothetical protein
MLTLRTLLHGFLAGALLINFRSRSNKKKLHRQKAAPAAIKFEKSREVLRPKEGLRMTVKRKGSDHMH